MDDDFTSFISTEYPVRVSLAGPDESSVLVGSDCVNKHQPMVIPFFPQLDSHFTTFWEFNVFNSNNMQLAISISKNEELLIERK